MLQHAYSSNEIKALAAARALSLASEIGVTRNILEGDSLVIIKAVTRCLQLAPWLKMLSLDLFDLLIYFTLMRRGNVILLLMV